jgi:hypothetical protein
MSTSESAKHADKDNKRIAKPTVRMKAEESDEERSGHKPAAGATSPGALALTSLRYADHYTD